MQNPSLREEPRNRKATIIPSKDSMSILDWMRKQGRLIEQTPEPAAPLAEEDIEDIDDLIGDEEFGDFDDED
ncbi:MAG: DUF3134 family protein [Synechococcaceae cyanobacterium SM2_3_1]|nr:DUF3134 family protein [Synechococcaceae cyanobacterium SM2_3_1]